MVIQWYLSFNTNRLVSVAKLHVLCHLIQRVASASAKEGKVDQVFSFKTVLEQSNCQGGGEYCTAQSVAI
jgi:hypothetical protein